MTRIPVSSTSVASVGYDATTMTLQVEFKKSGYVYDYFEVPETVYRELLAAESVGTYVNQNIRSAFRYARV